MPLCVHGRVIALAWRLGYVRKMAALIVARMYLFRKAFFLRPLKLVLRATMAATFFLRNRGARPGQSLCRERTKAWLSTHREKDHATSHGSDHFSARLLNRPAAVVSLALISLFTQSATSQALPDALSIRKEFFRHGRLRRGRCWPEGSFPGGRSRLCGRVHQDGRAPSNTVPKGADIVAPSSTGRPSRKTGRLSKGRMGSSAITRSRDSRWGT